jgi:transposase
MNSAKLRQQELAEARALKQERDEARKRTAMKMLDDGATLDEVASAVKADTKTVKRWREEAKNP